MGRKATITYGQGTAADALKVAGNKRTLQAILDAWTRSWLAPGLR
jgi:hypothetical protein